jgi:hypothetical protein
MTLTGPDYIARLQALVQDGRFAEARELDQHYGADVLLRLTAEEFVYLTSVMEIIERTAGPATASSTSDTVGAGSRPDVGEG